MTHTPKPIAKPDAGPNGEPRISLEWRMAGIVVIVVATLLALTWRTPRKAPPGEILGEWQTTDPQYADRIFEIDGVCISFTTGEGTISVGFIRDVNSAPAGDSTLYTVSYTVDGVPNVVSFFYNPNNGGKLWFKNQTAVIWKKTAEI